MDTVPFSLWCAARCLDHYEEALWATVSGLGGVTVRVNGTGTVFPSGSEVSIDTLAEVDVRGVAHITGGGIPGNLPRALPDDVGYWLDPATWDVPPIFGRIQELGDVSDEEMAKVFNLGIGMVLVVAPADADRTIALLADRGHAARAVGEVTKA